MFGNILQTPEGRKAFKRVMVDVLRAGTPTAKVTANTQTQTQKKKKKANQTSGGMQIKRGGKGRRSLIST